MIYGNKIGGSPVNVSDYVLEMEVQDENGQVYTENLWTTVVTDESIPELTACCKDVLAGKWFVGKNGLEQGTNDSPCCRVTSGIHEVYPGVDFRLCIAKRDQWNYTTFHGIITNKSTPYKVENLIMDCAVYDSEGNKVADITKEPNSCSIKFMKDENETMKNETSEVQLLHFFVCKEEYNV